MCLALGSHSQRIRLPCHLSLEMRTRRCGHKNTCSTGVRMASRSSLGACQNIWRTRWIVAVKDRYHHRGHDTETIRVDIINEAINSFLMLVYLVIRCTIVSHRLLVSSYSYSIHPHLETQSSPSCGAGADGRWGFAAKASIAAAYHGVSTTSRGARSSPAPLQGSWGQTRLCHNSCRSAAPTRKSSAKKTAQLTGNH